jgi:hypothetical protein
MKAGEIKNPAPIDADAITMATARENCAANLRERGYACEAAAFERGDRDNAWALRHEVVRLQSLVIR